MSATLAPHEQAEVDRLARRMTRTAAEAIVRERTRRRQAAARLLPETSTA